MHLPKKFMEDYAYIFIWYEWEGLIIRVVWHLVKKYGEPIGLLKVFFTLKADFKKKVKFLSTYFSACIFC